MNRCAFLGSLLCLASCFGSKEHALFEGVRDVGDGAAGAAVALAGSSGAHSGTDSGSAAQSNGGASGAAAGALSETGDSAGAVVGGGAGTTGGAPQQDVPRIEDCSMVEGAVTSELNGHCYRVNLSELTFIEARDACHDAGGHLLTISSAQENQLTAALHDGDHWIGASDGRADTESGVGSYAWVVEEAFDYADWEAGQPNAFETNCPGQGDESDCFEHCAFQSNEGDWNDRSCWHTIVSICEWDIAAESGSGGAAGSPP